MVTMIIRMTHYFSPAGKTFYSQLNLTGQKYYLLPIGWSFHGQLIVVVKILVKQLVLLAYLLYNLYKVQNISCR